jgi:hypothetical protein
MVHALLTKAVFYARTKQILIISIIKKNAPQLLLEDGKTAFRVFIEWMKRFIKSELNWTILKATTATSKFPNDWKLQGVKMAQCVAYLVKCYNMPLELVVDTDQIGIHLMLARGTRTWEEKGSKSVIVVGQEDKRQVIEVVSSSSTWHILPFQVIFTRITKKCLPPMNTGQKLCKNVGWHITNSSNHWSNLNTCKDFVQKILQPYRLKQVEVFGLNKETPIIWLIDCTHF